MAERNAKGHWVKGSASPNPAGRPKGAIADLQQSMRTYGGLACRTLVTICKNRTARASDRIAAAKEILDRGFGRPLQQLDATVVMRRLGEMTDAELAALEQRLVAVQLGAETDNETGTLN
jgi:hypothetical protein